ncbi:hypothetical protein [Shimazuella kribbensis]|uniref:hypothetical protein n=1 Tax=Shimazuella kribbensis TaxID=139808 RepID=UPI00048D00E0|nr:hypothetical protein [Shimazuella kribbensis]
MIGRLNKEKPALFVISDLRLPNERLFAFENEIPVIKMESDYIVRLERMKKENDDFNPKSFSHETEIWPDLLMSDFKIENNSSIEEVTKQFDELRERFL